MYALITLLVLRFRLVSAVYYTLLFGFKGTAISYGRNHRLKI